MSKRTIVIALGAILVLVVGWQAVAFANHVLGAASGFEDDDGNLADDSGNSLIDWNTFAPVTWTQTATPATPTRTATKTITGIQFKGVEDWQATGADSAFAGGTKQDDNCATVNTGKAPNKDDLKRIYLSSHTGANGHTYLQLAWVRIPQNTTSASAHVGFEFNQNDGDVASERCSTGGLVQRKAGDLLIVYDFEGGSDEPVITLRKWVTSGACEVGSSSPPCWGPSQNLSANNQAEAAVNVGTTVSDALAPPSSLATGTSVSQDLNDSEFGEAGIDLTAAGVFTTGTCQTFGKAFGVSRSSGNSAQAQMKDLVGPTDFNLQNCGTVNIIKQTSPAGLDQNFDFTSSNSTLAGTCTIGATPETTPASFTLNDKADATDSLTCTAVPAGTYTVTEGADPTGFTFTDLSCTASGTGTSATPTGPQSATKVASITMAGGGTVTCTYTNTQQLGAIEITKTGKDKSNGGNAAPLAGATFSITKGGTAITGSPFTTDANGEVCVDNLAFGNDYSVTETGAPDGYAIDDDTAHAVTVDNNAKCSDDPFGGETLSFTDTPLTDLSVTATSQSDGANGTGATESSIKCVDKDAANFGTGTDVGDSPQPATGTDNPVTVTANGLEPGTYTCQVVIDP